MAEWQEQRVCHNLQYLSVFIYHLSHLWRHPWLSIRALPHRTAAALFRCIWMSAAWVPWCVSLCQSLWFWMAGWGKKGRRQQRLFPFNQQSSGPSGKHSASLPFTPRMQCVCAMSVQSCGCRARQGDEFGLYWPGQQRKWRSGWVASGTGHAIARDIDQLCISSWHHYSS